MGDVAADIRAKECVPELTPAEVNCHKKMQELGILGNDANGCEESELAMVGAGIGGEFGNTAKLMPMKFDEAMKTKDGKGWEMSADEEHNRFLKHNVFKPVPEDQVPTDEKVVSTTWAMKKKANGALQARLNAQGFEQVDGVHHDEDDKATPAANDIIIHLHCACIDGCGAF